MPSRGTPKVTLRVPEPDWQRFGEGAQAVGMDRAAALRAFIAWFNREPGAKLPQRPQRPV